MKVQVSGRFSEEKLRKRLLLHGACGAATTPCPQDKNFLRSLRRDDRAKRGLNRAAQFGSKKRPLSPGLAF